ncbi:hypothetical protein ANN_04077 [Periplaneta americana]|uniref:Uncharacterized protein n=1 Tax=Periplaneta americana TaxID=6978 RepID=A0ABQ8T8S4_PERAM|nr:hypothetical protein ANN_04077 [Periplaneta americana]
MLEDLVASGKLGAHLVRGKVRRDAERKEQGRNIWKFRKATRADLSQKFSLVSQFVNQQRKRLRKPAFESGVRRAVNLSNCGSVQAEATLEKLLSSSLLSKNLKVRIYKTVILPVVLYGCETWTLTLREEHRLRVFENKVLRKIFGAKRDEVTGEWRKLHNTELHALYSSPDIIRNIKSRRLRWAGHVARMGESRNAYRVLVGRPEGKRPLERPRRRWEDNIEMDLREVGYDDRDWINLAQDRDRWRAYSKGLNHMEFRALLDDINSEYGDLLTISRLRHNSQDNSMNDLFMDERVTVWGGVMAHRMFGPLFFENEEEKVVTVNGERYRHMLDTFLRPLLDV